MKLQEMVNFYNDFINCTEQVLIHLAQENPDFVYNPGGYNSCSYNGPALKGPECNGCLFGQTFQLMGWDEKEEMDTNLTIEDLFKELTNIEAPYNWRTVQEMQDDGCSWGEAIQQL